LSAVDNKNYKFYDTLNDAELKLLIAGTEKYKEILDIELDMEVQHNQNKKAADDKAAEAADAASKKKQEKDKKAKEDADKLLEDAKKAQEQAMKDQESATEALLKKIAQQSISLIANDNERALAQIEYNNFIAQEEIKNSLASNYAKNLALIEQEKVYQQELSDLREKGFVDKKIEVTPLGADDLIDKDFEKKLGDITSSISESIQQIGDEDLKNVFQGLNDSIAAIFDKNEKNPKEKALAALKGIQAVAQGVTGIIEKSIDNNIANFDKLIDAQKGAFDRATELADKGNSQLLEAEIRKMDNNYNTVSRILTKVKGLKRRLSYHL
jgi:hypothetical protein